MRIQARRGTAAQWTANNPTLAAGELGVETDTGRIKAGNGSAAWANLHYIDTARLPGPGTPPASRWLVSGTTGGAVAYGESTTYALPVLLSAPTSIDLLGVETTVAGSAGAKIRIGVWSLSGATATLVLDAGQVDATATPGLLTASFATVTLPQGVYLLGAANQGAAGTRPTVRFGTSYSLPTLGIAASASAMTGAAAAVGLSLGAAAGAFGASATPAVATSAPLIHARVA